MDMSPGASVVTLKTRVCTKEDWVGLVGSDSSERPGAPAAGLSGCRRGSRNGTSCAWMRLPASEQPYKSLTLNIALHWLNGTYPFPLQSCSLTLLIQNLNVLVLGVVLPKS